MWHFFYRHKNESSCDRSFATDAPEVCPGRYAEASCVTFDDNNLEMPHVSYDVLNITVLICLLNFYFCLENTKSIIFAFF